MSIRDPQWLNQPALLNYGAAVLSVVVALFSARLLQTQYDFEPLVPFICAMMFSAWIGGIGPGLLTVALSLLAFHYYFLLAIYPSGMDKEMPRLLVAAAASVVIVLVSAARRSATDALRESELRLRQIAENIRGVFWMTTPDMKELLYVSPAYRSMWGRTEESLHRLPRSFMEVIHPEDRDYACNILNGQRGQGFDLEYRIVRPDGAVRWIHDRGFPV
jgi:PAS domain S-box-containing protein